MEFVQKTFDELTNRELYEILRAREAVFVVEQNCPYYDIDGLDYPSLHMFYKEEDGSVQACLRIFEKVDEPGTMQIDRSVGDSCERSRFRRENPASGSTVDSGEL